METRTASSELQALKDRLKALQTQKSTKLEESKKKSPELSKEPEEIDTEEEEEEEEEEEDDFSDDEPLQPPISAKKAEPVPDTKATEPIIEQEEPIVDNSKPQTEISEIEQIKADLRVREYKEYLRNEDNWRYEVLLAMHKLIEALGK